ncbi:MAG: neutral/alkaline non-lysosomal ceramidase N-terminal domain-containing protein, partial [Gammaproteobacteria bacterium]|nr:neutral/alkaline non-lysosomal ceramidase N-terminal domain-containing protein [Gammaproteobacteria bacterium]
GGYSARDPKENEGVLTPVYVKALSFANGKETFTYISADILLPLEDYVNAVVEGTHLPRANLFFTSSHTHSGPGGYQEGLVAQMSLGDFHPHYFQTLVQQTIHAVNLSRSRLKPAQLSYQRMRLSKEQVAHFVYDQLNKGPNGYPTLHALQLQELNSKRDIATLITFSAHPTFLGRVNKKIHGDYPSLLVSKLELSLGHPVIFSIGAVGGSLPMGLGKPPMDTVDVQLAQMESMSNEFHDILFNSLNIRPRAVNDKVKGDTFQTEIQWQASSLEIGSLVSEVQLPSPTYRLTDQWRLSPLMINGLFHSNTSYLHALRLGRIMFIGFPADTSGELAKNLEDWAAKQPIYPWVTSFNGDYIGYLSAQKRYSEKHYTVRDVNLFGPWGGDYLTEVAKEISLKVSQNPL